MHLPVPVPSHDFLLSFYGVCVLYVYDLAILILPAPAYIANLFSEPTHTIPSMSLGSSVKKDLGKSDVIVKNPSKLDIYTTFLAVYSPMCECLTLLVSHVCGLRDRPNDSFGNPKG